MSQKTLKENKEETYEFLKGELKIVFKKVLSSSKLKRLLIHDEENKIKQIFACYDKYEAIIKKWMDKNCTEKGVNVSLDRHKRAAAFFCAILKVKPFSFDTKKNPNTPKSLHERQANQLCAYLFGLQVIQVIINTMEYDEDNELSGEECLIYKKEIVSPDVRKDVHKTEYTEWFIKLVEGMDKYFDYDLKNSFIEKLIFYISHIYFMIDRYSYQYNRAELYKEEINSKAKKK